MTIARNYPCSVCSPSRRRRNLGQVRMQSSLFRIAKASQRGTGWSFWKELQKCHWTEKAIDFTITYQRQYTMFEQASNNLKRVTSQVGWRVFHGVTQHRLQNLSQFRWGKQGCACCHRQGTGWQIMLDSRASGTPVDRDLNTSTNDKAEKQIRNEYPQWLAIG